MAEIPNNHLGCMKPYKQWDFYPQHQLVSGISAINSSNNNLMGIIQDVFWGSLPSPSRRPMPSHHQWQTQYLGDTKNKPKRFFKRNHPIFFGWHLFFGCNLYLGTLPKDLKLFFSKSGLPSALGACGGFWVDLKVDWDWIARSFFFLNLHKSERKKNDHCCWPFCFFQGVTWKSWNLKISTILIGETLAACWISLASKSFCPLNQPKTQPTNHPSDGF